MEVMRVAWPRNTRVDRGIPRTPKARNGVDAVITEVAPLIPLVEVAVAAVAIGQQQQQQAASPDFMSASLLPSFKLSVSDVIE